MAVVNNNMFWETDENKLIMSQIFSNKNQKQINTPHETNTTNRKNGLLSSSARLNALMISDMLHK